MEKWRRRVCTSLPWWHQGRGHKEPSREPCHGADDGREAVSKVWLAHDDKDEQGDPGVVQGDVDEGDLQEYPHVVLGHRNHLHGEGGRW